MRSVERSTNSGSIDSAKTKWLLLLPIIFALLWQLPCNAELKPDLSDSYLQTQFAWAMYIDAHDVDYYLNYVGSKLHPLTKVRIRFRYFPHDARPVNWPAKTYDEFWYYQGRPVGLRRYGQINLKPNDMGAIVIGPADDHFKSSLSVTDALVRLLVSLQLQHAVVGVVVVPPDQYDQVLVSLQRYHFSPIAEEVNGPQLKIHLRCGSGGAEQDLFLH